MLENRSYHRDDAEYVLQATYRNFNEGLSLMRPPDFGRETIRDRSGRDRQSRKTDSFVSVWGRENRATWPCGLPGEMKNPRAVARALIDTCSRDVCPSRRRDHGI